MLTPALVAGLLLTVQLVLQGLYGLHMLKHASTGIPLDLLATAQLATSFTL